jgi:hypothetical protein
LPLNFRASISNFVKIMYFYEPEAKSSGSYIFEYGHYRKSFQAYIIW